MNAMSYTEARQTLAKTMENVCSDHEPVIITSKRDKAVVMISLEDYKAMEETSYLLRSPKNAKRLIESIAELEKGKGKVHELVECE
jgi:antitoxin YefM